ncbi:sigma-54-dependent Fis family transcriptional regulator [Shewanella sp. OPT22]|nr:sigma-54-dependent Fis family transcriptional regulator [Shewanella sp. OPT22]
MQHSIIVADDDMQILAALKLLLNAEGYEVTAVTSPQALLQHIKITSFSVALIDLNYQRDTTSGQEGLELLNAIKDIDECLPVVVMTGFSNIDIAVNAMKSGAADFVQKPWENDRLLNILQAQIRLFDSEQKSRKLIEQNTLLKKEVSPEPADLIAISSSMKHVLSQIEKLALSDMNILFTGENGTGKSVFAEYLHLCSSRTNQPFISVNMGAISETVFESEMFGHVKGAFTDAKSNRIGRLELAEQGTLFLDEIGNIPLSQQAKLLRVLEARQYEKLGSSKTFIMNARVISATNANLSELIEEGRFRQDLLYRLNTVEVRIPALRERTEDIIPLAEHFLIQHANKYGIEQQGFEAEAIYALKQYSWPGNIRELNHMIERAIFLRKDIKIDVEDLGLHTHPTVQDLGFEVNHETLEHIEKYIIQRRLAHFDNKAKETMESLGLSRSAYYRRIEKHNL